MRGPRRYNESPFATERDRKQALSRAGVRHFGRHSGVNPYDGTTFLDTASSGRIKNGRPRWTQSKVEFEGELQDSWTGACRRSCESVEARNLRDEARCACDSACGRKIGNCELRCVNSDNIAVVEHIESFHKKLNPEALAERDVFCDARIERNKAARLRPKLSRLGKRKLPEKLIVLE